MEFKVGNLVKEKITSKNNIGIIVEIQDHKYSYVVFLQSFIRNEEHGLYFFFRKNNMKKGSLLIHKRYGSLWIFVEQKNQEWIRVLSVNKKNLPYQNSDLTLYTELKVDFIEI